MDPLRKAEKALIELCNDEFEVQFGVDWIVGFIQLVKQVNNQYASMCFVRVEKGKGRWFDPKALDLLIPCADELIEIKRQNFRQINSIRVHVRIDCHSAIDYLEEPETLKEIPFMQEDQEWSIDEEIEEKLIYLTASFLKKHNLKAFNTATFRFYRFQNRFCGLFRLDDLFGEVMNLEIPLPEVAERVLQQVWVGAQYPKWKVLQVLYDKNFVWEITAFDDYILRTLENKIYPPFAPEY